MKVLVRAAIALSMVVTVALVSASGDGVSAVPSLASGGASAAHGKGVARLSGRVHAGGDDVARARVVLYSATDRARPKVLGVTRTDRRGNFTVRYKTPKDPDAVVYAMSRGGWVSGRPLPLRFRLAAVFAPGDAPAAVVLNEISTVGSAYSMAQFVSRRGISGPSPGMPRAAAMVGHLADVTTGEQGFSVRTYATRTKTTPATINSLANMIAACTEARSACRDLLDLAATGGGRRPTDTFEAIAMIADDPSIKAAELFELSTRPPATHQPALPSAPDAWTVAVRLMGEYVTSGDAVIGGQLDGPGLIAFDSDGDAWISNNYEWGLDPLSSVCAGKQVFELDPTVTGPAVVTDSLTGYAADQLWGAGFGIAVGPRDHVWVGNFGFQGRGCGDTVFNESVSLFGPEGNPISPEPTREHPSGGFREGNISGPQGMLSDEHGNMWIANCGNRSVTLYPEGNPKQAINIAPDELQQPFGLWLDDDGNAWVASNQSGQVFAFAPDGSQLPGSPFGDPTPERQGDALLRSMGITVDSLGNKWVANSFWVDAPCDDWAADAFEGLEPGGSLTLLQTDGADATLTKFTADSLANPWGVAVDGEDHVFVANFGNQRLAEFCGVRVDTCPSDAATGDPIGDNGYPYDGLTRNTGVSIDPSGHVWLANNWLDPAFQANPGGHAAVVYFGLASPVQTPLLGPPKSVFD